MLTPSPHRDQPQELCLVFLGKKQKTQTGLKPEEVAATQVLLLPKVARVFPSASVSPVTLYRNYFLQREEKGRPKGVLHYRDGHKNSHSSVKARAFWKHQQ